MVTTSGLSFFTCSMASRPLAAVPTTSIALTGLRISRIRRRKKPESSTTNTLIAIGLSCYFGPGSSIAQAADGDQLASYRPSISRQQTGNIQNQGNPTVTGNGGARHPRRTMQHGPQWFNHHLFLPNQLIHNQHHLFVTDRNDHDMSKAFLPFLPGRPLDQPALDMEQRVNIFPHHDTFLTINDIGPANIQMENLDHAHQGQGK